ncbi:hypothetical protein QOZ80_9AG0672990 [Eleusine coracana subsp. coracana]|nr:hypothetical protein QOZ80_9AG0672990 [Eleusine coracana subsp. coracana]
MCSLLPKGYRIDKEQLIDQWIAHDMIPLTDGDDLEHIGDQYFNSLVQISFLQDVNENSDGRVKCTMHDLVHDLSRSILSDEISFVLPEDTTNSTKRYRYFSLTERSRNPWSKHLCAKARAVYVSCGQYFIFDDAFKNTKHLRSITVECICTRAVPTTILQIKNLRYLHISALGCQTLPEAISDVWSLQSLHVTYSHLIELPRSIGKLQKLRAVNLSHCFRLESLPDSLGDCPMISSIDLYNCKNFTTLPNSICKNKHLRVLRLGLTRIERMPSGITALENLECLDLRMCCELEELPEGIGNLKNLVVMNLEGCRGLESMPVGIGQLSQLRKLGLFAVKEGESFAKISELGNIGKIDGELTIRGIARGMDPYEAQKACLKRNTNLRSLTLMWETNGRVNTENELLVLHYLEPPDAIKCLEVHGYAGLLYPWWLLKQGGHLRFPRLSILELSDFPKLKHLHELVELPCLEKLILTGMPRLESISGGPFPSLAKFYMQKLPRLGELWLVTERSLVVGEEGSDCINSIPLTGLLQIGNYLSRLVISECPELKIKPYMPISLQDLMLDGANEQLLQSPGQGQESSWFSSDADLRPSLLNFGHLMELRLWSMTVASSSSSTSVSGFGCEREPLQHLMELETLQISNFNCLTELPESMWSLTSLQSLTIAYCSALVQLPERLGELCSLKGLWIEGLPGLRSFPQSLQHLTSLVSLNIGGCDALYHLPECVGELHSLTHFEIWNLPGLTSLPQSMRRLTSLEELSITECPGLTSLPEWISELTSLELLDISGCPVLMRRYEKGKGEDCHLTAHIPFIF